MTSPYRNSSFKEDRFRTQPIDMPLYRFNQSSKFLDFSSNFANDDLTFSDLKREYMKALNYIEILKLEKSNLEDTLKIAQNLPKNQCGTRRGEFGSSSSFTTERKIIDLEQELIEHRKLLEKALGHVEILKEENQSYKKRLQDIDYLRSCNNQLKDEFENLSNGFEETMNRVVILEEEKASLLNRLAQLTSKPQKSLPQQELLQYVDNIYDLINSLNANHYACSRFQECFHGAKNIEILIQEKDSNQLLLQAFKYIVYLLANLLSPINDHLRPTQASSGSSAVDSQRRSEIAVDHLNDQASASLCSSKSSQAEGAQACFTYPTPDTKAAKSFNAKSLTDRLSHKIESFGEENMQSESEHIEPGQDLLDYQRNSELASQSRASVKNNSQSCSSKSNKSSGSKRDLEKSPQLSKSSRSERSVSFASHKTAQNDCLKNEQEVCFVPSARKSSYGKIGDEVQNEIEQKIEEELASSEALKIKKLSNDLAEREKQLKELDRELTERENFLRMKEKVLLEKSVGQELKIQEKSPLKLIFNELNCSSTSKRSLASQSILKEKSGVIRSPAEEREYEVKIIPSDKKSNCSDLERINDDSEKDSMIAEIKAALKIEVDTRSEIVSRMSGSFLKNQDILEVPLTTSLHNFTVKKEDKCPQSPRSNSVLNKCGATSDPISISEVTPEVEESKNVPFESKTESRTLKLYVKPKATKVRPEENTYRRDEQITSSQAEAGAAKSPISKAINRHIEFNTKSPCNIRDCSSPNMQTPSEMNSTFKNSGLFETTGKKVRDARYPSFGGYSGRTRDKTARNITPDTKGKDSLYIMDVKRRKRVTHNDQTYDVLKGSEVLYSLTADKSGYNLSKTDPKPRNVVQSQVFTKEQL